MTEMPSPKSSHFRITVTENNNMFLTLFSTWYQKHSSCEKVWWNKLYSESADTTATYVIQFQPEKSYSNFCELLKIAIKCADHTPVYTVSIEKEFADKRDFRLLWEKDKSIFAPLKCWDDFLQEKAYTEKQKILSRNDFNFRNLYKLIDSINDKIILNDTIGFSLRHEFYDSTYNLGAHSYLTSILKATIPIPFIIDAIEQVSKTNEWYIRVKYVYGVQPLTTKPELYYREDFSTEEKLDFYNRLFAFTKKGGYIPEEYSYPFQKMAEFNEKVFEDFDSEEHRILKLIEDKKKRESEIAGTGLNDSILSPIKTKNE